MSYPPPQSHPGAGPRRSSAADKYTPPLYAHSSPAVPQVQAAKSGGYLAPNVPSTPLPMPEPNVAYRPPQSSPLMFGSTPPGAPPPMPHHQVYSTSPSNAYTSAHAPPYPVQDPALSSSPRLVDPRRYSHSSQRSYHSQPGRRPSHGNYPPQATHSQAHVHFDEKPHFDDDGDLDEALAYDSEPDDDDRHRHHHHSHSHQHDYTPSSSSGSRPHHSQHHHHHHKTGSKSRYDDHRPTLGDTVMTMVNGLKDYVSK